MGRSGRQQVRWIVVAVVTLTVACGTGGDDEVSSGDGADVRDDVGVSGGGAEIGDDGGDDGGSVALSTGGAPTTGATIPPVPVDVAVTAPPGAAETGWVTGMTAAWKEWSSARGAAADSWLEGGAYGDDLLERTQPFYEAEVDAIDALTAAVGPESGIPSVDAAVEALLAVVAEMAEAATAAHDLGADDPEAVRVEVAAASDAAATPYGAAYVAYSELEGDLIGACFGLQDAMEAAGMGLLDCTGSSDSTTTRGEVLEPGLHRFEDFGPGLTVETDQPVIAFETPDEVGFSDPDPESYFFAVVADAEFVDPASLSIDPSEHDYIPAPDDLGAWLSEFPITVVDEGTVPIGGAEVNYWAVEPDVDAVVEALGEPTVVELARYDVSVEQFTAAGVIVIPAPGYRVALAEWRRGDERLLVYWFAEPPTDLGVAEDYMVEILSAAE
jgi:hypothetical protein